MIALTNAFLPPQAAPAAGKAVSRLPNQRAQAVVVVQQQQQQQQQQQNRRRHQNNNNNNNPLVLHNALREYANWNDVWDGDYGYGGYGMGGMSGGGYGPYRSGYRRGGGGGYGGGGGGYG